jgi:osmoprotectant transport system permease protein
LAWAAGIGLIVILVGGLLPEVTRLARGPAISEASEIHAAADEAGLKPTLAGQDLTVGSKGFTEQYILAELLSLNLEAAGATVHRRPNMGSTILFDALQSNTVDVVVDYSGTIWATIMKRPEPIDRTEMLIEVAKFLKDEYGVITLGRLGFENAYALAMSHDRAVELGVLSIGDLGPLSDRLTLGGDPEFFGRLEWARVREIYGLDAMRTRGMDSTFMYGAVNGGKVDVITAYSTDGRIAAFELVVLSDPKQAFPPYDAILLLSPRAAKNQQLIRTLVPLVNAVTDKMMRSANMAVDIDGLSVEQSARQLYRRMAGRNGGSR